MAGPPVKSRRLLKPSSPKNSLLEPGSRARAQPVGESSSRNRKQPSGGNLDVESASGSYPPDSPKRRRLTQTNKAEDTPRRSARLTAQAQGRPQIQNVVAATSPSVLRPATLPAANTRKSVKREPVHNGGAAKRKFSSDDTGKDRVIKQARLTKKNLARLNKMARRKGSSKSSIPGDSTAESTITKTTSTTSSGFAIRARKNGILNPLTSKPPRNLREIQDRYAQPRKTVSPTESTFEKYVNTVSGVPNEATLVFEAGNRLLKEFEENDYQRSFNQAFTGFPKDVGFNDGLSAPQPDYVEGLRMEAFQPFPVNSEVDGAVLYKDDPLSMTLPHLAGEWKGPGGAMAEAIMQSAYDGAALVYARNQALEYLGKADPPGNAEITTFATDGTTLNVYAHYAMPTEGADDGDGDIDGDRDAGPALEYHQYRVRSATLINSRQEYSQARRGLRNEQQHAWQEAHVLRDHLKEHWKQRRHHAGVLRDSGAQKTSDILEEEYEDAAVIGEDGSTAGNNYVTEDPCQPTPTASSVPTGNALRRDDKRDHPRRNNNGRKRKAATKDLRGHSRPRKAENE